MDWSKQDSSDEEAAEIPQVFDYLARRYDQVHNAVQATSTSGRNAAPLWASPFLRSLLDSWLQASATENGIFHPNLDRQWRKMEGAAPTLVSQCRLIYNFSRGFQAFHDSRYAGAAVQGLNALARFFYEGKGGYSWSVMPNGVPLDKTPNSYGHAFCILALSAAAEALGDPALAGLALTTWGYTLETFTDASGGFVWQGSGADALVRDRSQNPLMHLFEALMALHAVDPTGRALPAARRLLEFVSDLAGFQEGRLIEAYAADWRPLPVENGGVVNIGHQFEWAFLLSEWHKATGDSNALETGLAFLETGLTWGLDTDGGVWEACTPEGHLVTARKNLWPQCEAVRALSRYARCHAQTHMDEPLQQTLGYYRQHFVDEEYGGPFAVDQDRRPNQPHKGDVWKLDYHSLGMCLELMADGDPA